MEKKAKSVYPYPHARSEVSSDVVVFGYEPDKEIHILLVHKKFHDPDTGGFTNWALPGRFMHGANEYNADDPEWEYGEGVETLEECVQRALTIQVNVTIAGEEDILPVWEYNLSHSFWEYLPPKTKPDRDKRGKRVISLPVMVFVKMDKLSSFQEKVVRWVPVSQIENDNPYSIDKTGCGEFKLPFDHEEIFHDGIERLRQISHVQLIGKEILGDFTINQLQKFYEAIFGGTIEKSGFRKWLLDDSRKLIEALDKYDRTSSNRPAQYYKFNEKTYDELRRTKTLGFNPTVTPTKK